MRKRIIGPGPREVAAAEPGWMDLERLAQVEITSEDADYPIESALIPGTGSGWRAAQPGEQTIRLLFDEPLSLKRIRLCSMKMSGSAPRSSFYGGRLTRSVVPGDCAPAV
jgi:hypothetical protein